MRQNLHILFFTQLNLSIAFSYIASYRVSFVDGRCGQRFLYRDALADDGIDDDGHDDGDTVAADWM